MLALPAPGRPMTKPPPLRSSAANCTASGRCLPRASTLSGGQQQTPAIDRPLMDRPTSLLLDKPSVGIARPLKMEIELRRLCSHRPSKSCREFAAADAGSDDELALLEKRQQLLHIPGDLALRRVGKSRREQRDQLLGAPWLRQRAPGRRGHAIEMMDRFRPRRRDKNFTADLARLHPRRTAKPAAQVMPAGRSDRRTRLWLASGIRKVRLERAAR